MHFTRKSLFPLITSAHTYHTQKYFYAPHLLTPRFFCNRCEAIKREWEHIIIKLSFDSYLRKYAYFWHSAKVSVLDCKYSYTNKCKQVKNQQRKFCITVERYEFNKILRQFRGIAFWEVAVSIVRLKSQTFQIIICGRQSTL